MQRTSDVNGMVICTGGIHITIRKATSLSCDQLENPLESASLGVEDGNLEQDFERRLGACQNDVLPFTGYLLVLPYFTHQICHSL